MRAKGERAEQAALKYLRHQGLKLLEKNFKGNRFEIDLILQDGTEIVFVEVRSKAQDRFGTPEETIDSKKQERIYKGAQAWCQQQNLTDQYPIRFDVIALSGGEIHWIKDAFEY